MIDDTKIAADDGALLDGFDVSVAIDGTTAIVGRWEDQSDISRSGSAYLFDATTGAQTGKLVPSDRANQDFFSQSWRSTAATPAARPTCSTRQWAHRPSSSR